MRKIMYLLLAATLLLSILAGCQKKDEKQSEADVQDMIQSLQKEGNMKPGAKVETSKDEKGNAKVEYTNPDGSGGGGIVYD